MIEKAERAASLPLYCIPGETAVRPSAYFIGGSKRKAENCCCRKNEKGGGKERVSMAWCTGWKN